MKNSGLLAIFAITLSFSFFIAGSFAASVANTTQTWIVPDRDSLSLTVNTFKTNGTANRCLDSNGQQLDINVTVIALPENQLDLQASVDANVIKPNGDVNNISFSNAADGNYTYRYTFDSNGTHRIQIHAVDVLATGDKNIFVHVGSVGMDVTFPVNGQTYNPNTTQIITARVVNTDGNIFEAIDGNVTINYPSGSPFVSNEKMSNSGDGNYTYTFTVPSQTGTYTFSASFACGLNSDTNSEGTFIVPSSGGGGDTGGGTGGATGGGGGGGGTSTKAICGNFVCEKGESAKNCFNDCAVSAGPDGQLIGWSFQNGQKLGEPEEIVVDFKNNGNQKNDYIVSVTITQGRDIEYFYEQRVDGVLVQKVVNLVLEQKWVPLLGGSHEIVVALYSTDKRTKFDEIIDSFELGGQFRYDVLVECMQEFVRLGSTVDANITYINMGDFFEDVDITYWVEDFEGRIFGKSSLPVAIFPDESYTVIESVFVPDSFKPGLYSFRALVEFRDSVKEGSCSFNVLREDEYYLIALTELEKKLDAIRALSIQKENEGYDVTAIEAKIPALQQEIDGLRTKFSAGDFSGAEKDIDSLAKKIDSLRGELENLKLRFSLPLVFFALLFLLLLGLLLLLFAKRDKRHSSIGQDLLHNSIGLHQKPYSKPFKQKSLLDRLLGLK